MPVRVALDKEKIMNKFLQITLALSLGLGGASLGYVQGVRQSQHRFETSMRDEVEDIYDELAAMIFVSRINMNLATGKSELELIVKKATYTNSVLT